MQKSIQKILVPTDFSPCSDHALDYALLLRERFDARVELLHVWEVPQGIGVTSLPFITLADGSRASLTEYVRGEAERALAEKVAELRQRGVEVSSRLVAGDPARAIVDAASGFDLLVMGTHGRDGIAHLLMGSVAERVVRGAKCPVLTVREAAPPKS